jgi:predicted cupin superfamily sugar epimerase
MSPEVPASRIIEHLRLQPHPEGGWYRETFRDLVDGDGARAASTAVFYLLEQGQVSAWHRVRDAAEVWHHYAGGPLELALAPPERPTELHLLGPDLFAGQVPQIVVPMGWWQMARPIGDWALVGCTVAPGFEFASFEMAPAGWSPSVAG